MRRQDRTELKTNAKPVVIRPTCRLKIEILLRMRSKMQPKHAYLKPSRWRDLGKFVFYRRRFLMIFHSTYMYLTLFTGFASDLHAINSLGHYRHCGMFVDIFI